MPNALSQCVERPSLPGTSLSSEPRNRWFEESLIPRFKRAGCSRIGEPGDEKVLRPSVKGSGGRKAGPLRVSAWTFRPGPQVCAVSGRKEKGFPRATRGKVTPRGRGRAGAGRRGFSGSCR